MGASALAGKAGYSKAPTNQGIGGAMHRVQRVQKEEADDSAGQSLTDGPVDPKIWAHVRYLLSALGGSAVSSETLSARDTMADADYSPLLCRHLGSENR